MTSTQLFIDANALGFAFEGECVFSADPGLYVIVGKNNSGKSRLLKALHNAEFRRTIKYGDLSLPPPFGDHVALPDFQARRSRQNILSLGEGVLFEGRGMANVAPQLFKHITDAEHHVNNNVHRGAHRLFQESLFTAVGTALPSRGAIYVSTNRLMKEFAPQPNSVPIPFDPNQWPPETWAALLELLRASPQRSVREMYSEIESGFEYVTEGLRFAAVGGGTRHIHIYDGVGEHPLEHCGDGLRDILGVLIHLVAAPDCNLFVEEPGIRLHPAAQKRLLTILQAAAKLRAVWITSHDNPYIFARDVRARYTTTKEPGRIRVRTASSATEHLSCLRELGWEPAMAALADVVIYCEGRSDKLAFEAAFARIATGERVVALPLFGTGAITDDAQWPKLFDRIRATTELLPHIRQIVILDQDNEPEKRTKLLERLKETVGIAAEMLPVQMLESYWLIEGAIKDVVREIVRIATEEYGGGNSPDVAAIEAQISQTASEAHAKRRLTKMVEKLFPRAWSEERAVIAALNVAEDAVALLGQHLRDICGRAS